MTITLDLTPELEAELARRAAARGMRVDAYATSVLTEAIRALAGPPVFDKELAQAAAARIRELREGVTLGD